jgi:hypothetical protein
VTGIDGAREELTAAGLRLHALGLSPGASGNLSVRVPGGFLSTPTGTALGELTGDRLSALDEAGRPLRGRFADAPPRAPLVHDVRRDTDLAAPCRLVGDHAHLRAGATTRRAPRGVAVRGGAPARWGAPQLTQFA